MGNVPAPCVLWHMYASTFGAVLVLCRLVRILTCSYKRGTCCISTGYTISVVVTAPNVTMCTQLVPLCARHASSAWLWRRGSTKRHHKVAGYDSAHFRGLSPHCVWEALSRDIFVLISCAVQQCEWKAIANAWVWPFSVFSLLHIEVCTMVINLECNRRCLSRSLGAKWNCTAFAQEEAANGSPRAVGGKKLQPVRFPVLVQHVPPKYWLCVRAKIFLGRSAI